MSSDCMGAPLLEADLVSLFCIVVIALLAPIFSALVPNRMLPETVLLLIAGMVTTTSVSMKTPIMATVP